MILTLHTETVIDSAHKLERYNGKCKNFHGHSWLLKIWIRGDSKQKNKVGILFDFGNIKKIKEKYDHKIINEIPPFDKINPTAENLTEVIYTELKEKFPNLSFRIKIYETAVKKQTFCIGGDF